MVRKQSKTADGDNVEDTKRIKAGSGEEATTALGERGEDYQPPEAPVTATEEDAQEGEGEQSDEELGFEEAKEELEEFVPSELLDYVVSDNVGVRCLRALTKKEPEQLQAQLMAVGAACTEEQAQEIVTRAREQSLDEIWYQICHQNDQLVEVRTVHRVFILQFTDMTRTQVLETVRICTPRDLALWRMSIPELTNKVNHEFRKNTSSSSSQSSAETTQAVLEETSPLATEEQMTWSMRQAQRYRKKYPWLDDWITDIQA